MEKVTVEIEAKTGKAEASLRDVVDAIKNINKEVVNSNEKTKDSLKEVETASKKTTSIVKRVAKSFRGVGLAMKAAGFALIMKAVDALGEALMSNQQVVDMMSAAFETVSIVLKQVADVFIKMTKRVSEATGGFDALKKVLGGGLSIAINIVVGAIQGIVLGVQKAQLAWEESFLGDGDPKEIKRLNEAIGETQQKLEETGERISTAGKQIAGNFLEAVGEVGALAQGVAEATSEAIETIDVKQAIADGKRIANSKKNFERLALEQQRLVEKYDLQAEQQRQIRDDESKSINERIAANEELGRILLKQNEAEKKTVQSRIDALREEERLKGKSIELSNEIFELETEMIAIDAKVAGFKSEQLTNINALKREQTDLEKERIELEKEAEEKRLEELEQRAQREIEIEQQKTAAKQKAFDDAIAIAGAESKFGKAILIAKQLLLAKEMILEAKATLFSAKNSATKVAVKSAEAGVDISAGAAKTSSSVPFPANIPLIIGYAAQAVGIISAIKGAVSASKQATKGLGTSVPAPSIPTEASAPPAFNVVGASATNQLASAIGGQSQQPIQAYVVANDVTTGQSLDRNIVDGASLGG